MDAPLAPYLPRFSSAPPPPLLPPPSSIELDAFDDETLMTMPEPEPDVLAEESVTMTVADYEAKLHETGEAVRRDLETEHAASRDEAEARYVEALATAVAAAEAARDAEHGAAIAAQIIAAMEAMREAVSEDIARALRPLFEDAIVVRTTSAAAAAVAGAVADPDHPSLKVCGPASLLAAIETALNGVEGVEFTATDDDEVTVTANAIHIETRLAHALSALAEGDA